MSEYTDCMKPWMQGPKELAPGASAMCVGAKMCTGKAKNQQEAIQICQETPQKPATKKGMTKGAKCVANLDEYVECLLSKMDFNSGDLKGELRKSVADCFCGRAATKKEKARKVLEAIPEEALQALASISGIWGAPQAAGGKTTVQRGFYVKPKTVPVDQRPELEKVMNPENIDYGPGVKFEYKRPFIPGGGISIGTEHK
jgi:hypothetical protein